MSAKKVTVYLTNYNYGKFIEQAIESVLAQSYENFELLIIDDGSTDDSKDIILKYQSNSKVFILFQQNKGLNRTNNVAMKLARGEYIMRLDADDYLAPDALEKMVRRLDENPDTALVFPDYYNVNEEGQVTSQYQRIDFSDEDLLMDRPAHGAITMIRKNVLEEVGGYNENFSCQDGYDLWLKVFKKYKVQNINEPLFYYRAHGQNLTSDKERLLKTRAQMMDEFTQSNEVPSLNTACIIPVRGNSMDPRSLPLRKIGGKYLIQWTIEAALESNYANDVVVSTPDEGLRNFVNETYEGQVITLDRKEDLAQINTSISDTLRSVTEQLAEQNIQPDALMTLYIESPFRDSQYIDQAINHMRIYDVDAVDAVTEDNSFFYRHSGKGLVPAKNMSLLQLERDDMFKRCGGLHLIKTELIKSGKDIWRGKTGHLLLDQKASFTIKSELDFELAQYMAEKEV